MYTFARQCYVAERRKKCISLGIGPAGVGHTEAAKRIGTAVALLHGPLEEA
jgi:hypothetical protein